MSNSILLLMYIYLYPVFDVLETEDDDIEVENVDLRVFIVDGVVGLLEDPLANDNLALILEVGTKSKRGPKPCPSSSSSVSSFIRSWSRLISPGIFESTILLEETNSSQIRGGVFNTGDDDGTFLWLLFVDEVGIFNGGEDVFKVGGGAGMEEINSSRVVISKTILL